MFVLFRNELRAGSKITEGSVWLTAGVLCPRIGTDDGQTSPHTPAFRLKWFGLAAVSPKPRQSGPRGSLTKGRVSCKCIRRLWRSTVSSPSSPRGASTPRWIAIRAWNSNSAKCGLTTCRPRPLLGRRDPHGCKSRRTGGRHSSLHSMTKPNFTLRRVEQHVVLLPTDQLGAHPSYDGVGGSNPSCGTTTFLR
jgi:hypothetical protein